MKIEQADSRAAMKSVGQALADFVFGYDFFISYAWSDGREFAVSLEQQLKQRGYNCFLDSSEYASGDNWDLVGQRALRKTSNLILVGTEGALRSDPVLREVRRFTSHNQRVIPISFDASLHSDRPREGLLALLDPEVLRIMAPSAELVEGPSSATVDRLCGTYRIVRQSTKRQRIVTGVAIALATLTAFAVWQWRSAVLRRKEAEANLSLAQNQRTVALQGIKDSLFEVQTKLTHVPNSQKVQKRLGEIIANTLQRMATEKLPGEDLSYFAAISKIDIALVIAGIREAETTDPLALALGQLQEADTALTRLLQHDSRNVQVLRDLSWVSNEQGELYLRSRDPEHALPLFERGHQFIERAVEIQPKQWQLQHDRLWSNLKLGDYFTALADTNADHVDGAAQDATVPPTVTQALQQYQLAEKVAEQLETAKFSAAGSDMGATLDRLFDTYLQLGRIEDAKRCAEKGLAVRRQLLTDDKSDDKIARRNLAVALEKMGNLSLKLDDPTAALKWYKSSLELSQELSTSDPLNTEFERDVAMSYLKIASAQANLHHSVDTLSALERYRELIEKQAVATPFDAELQEDLKDAYRFLGGEYLKMSKPKEACEQFQKALDVLNAFNARAQRQVFRQQIEDLKQCLEECDQQSAAQTE